MFRTNPNPSLNVTSQTSLAELQRFSDAAGDNAKIRGKKNDDGSITIYASTKKGTGVENAIKQKRDDRQANAQQAIALVVRGVRGGQLDVATANILKQLPQGELRGAGLATILDQTRTARENAAQAPRSRLEMATALDEAIGSGHPDRLKQATAELGSYMAQYMNGKSAEQQLGFVTSRGDALKDAFLRALARELPPGNGPLASTYAQAGQQVRAVLDEAYTQALGKLPNHHVDDSHLVLNGTVYAKDRHLAAGGYGSVDVYKSSTGHEIAVKTPILKGGETQADKFDEAVREITAHHSATAGNPTNVIGLKGVVRTPDGGLQVAIELAGKGDAFSMIDKLNQKATAGQITPQEANLARLTIVKDMLQGMRHVQETRGMTHLDVKGPNFFVDGNGVTKLGDFGTAKTGNVQQLLETPVDNPLWQAPELLKGDKDRSDQVSAITKMAKASQQAASSGLNKALPKDQLDIARRHILHDRTARAEQQAVQIPAFSITSKVDTWSLGVEAYRAFTGTFPFDDPFMSTAMDKIMTFAQNPNNRVTIPTNVNLGLAQNDLADLNRLIGGLLHPDPQQRLSLTQALQNPIFQLQGVDSQAARDIIKQL